MPRPLKFLLSVLGYSFSLIAKFLVCMWAILRWIELYGTMWVFLSLWRYCILRNKNTGVANFLEFCGTNLTLLFFWNLYRCCVNFLNHLNWENWNCCEAHDEVHRLLGILWDETGQCSKWSRHKVSNSISFAPNKYWKELLINMIPILLNTCNLKPDKKYHHWKHINLICIIFAKVGSLSNVQHCHYNEGNDEVSKNAWNVEFFA